MSNTQGLVSGSISYCVIHLVYFTDVSKKPTYHLVKISDLVLCSPASRGGGGNKKMSDMSCTVADIYVVT